MNFTGFKDLYLHENDTKWRQEGGFLWRKEKALDGRGFSCIFDNLYL